MMIDKKAMKNIEDMLYKYYRDKLILDEIKRDVCTLKSVKEALEADIRENKCELVKSKERLFQTQIDILQKSLSIRDLEERNTDIEYVISLMPEEIKLFFELRYRDNYSLDAIAEMINISKTAAGRRREKSIHELLKYEI